MASHPLTAGRPPLHESGAAHLLAHHTLEEPRNGIPLVNEGAFSPQGRRVTFGLATTIVAAPTGIALAYPTLAAVLASAELTLLLTVLLTAACALYIPAHEPPRRGDKTMAETSTIEWTDATWNPVTGCTKMTPGCDNCYAETFAERWRGTPGHHFKNGFDITLRPNALTLPLRWRKPKRVFVNSMSDLFHNDVPDEYIAKVFAVMALTPQHTYQILTKRHGRMRALLSGRCDCGSDHSPGEHFRSAMAWAVSKANPDRVPGTPDDAEKRVYHDTAWPLRNVWLGVSVEDQKRADLRIPALLDTPAAIRFLSCEPLLGPVDLCGPIVPGRGRPKLTYWLDGRPGWGPEQTDDRGRVYQEIAVGPRIDWVIVGGESGRGARPMDLDWADQIVQQCQHSGVPVFVKQLGIRWAKHHKDIEQFPAALQVRAFPQAMSA